MASVRHVLTSSRGYRRCSRPLPRPATGCCAALRDADLRGAIGEIAAPTLVFAGTHDPVTPPADAEAIRARIRDARVTVLDAAHLRNVEQADAFNEPCLDFINEKGPHMDDSERRSAGMKSRRRVLGDAHVDRATARATAVTADSRI